MWMDMGKMGRTFTIVLMERLVINAGKQLSVIILNVANATCLKDNPVEIVCTRGTNIKTVSCTLMSIFQITKLGYTSVAHYLIKTGQANTEVEELVSADAKILADRQASTSNQKIELAEDHDIAPYHLDPAYIQLRIVTY